MPAGRKNTERPIAGVWLLASTIGTTLVASLSVPTTTTRLQTAGRLGNSIQPTWLKDDRPSQRCKRSSGSGADYDLSSWRQGLWCVERELLGVIRENMSYRAPPLSRVAKSQPPCTKFCDFTMTDETSDETEAGYAALHAQKAFTAGKHVRRTYNFQSQCNGKEGIFYEMVSSIGLTAASRLKVNISFYEATVRHQFGTSAMATFQAPRHSTEDTDPPESSIFHPQPQRASTGSDGPTQCGRNEYSVQARPLESSETRRLECNVTDIIMRCGNESNIFPHICPITHADFEEGGKARRPAPPGSPNVVICVIDGLSRAAFMSYFPKTVRFLEQSADPAHGFKTMHFPNFHAMGFSTVENIPWLLFGPHDARTREPRRSLFQHFQHHGYACAS